ncbi:MAG: hypothetical protein V4510_10040 [bacterium]
MSKFQRTFKMEVQGRSGTLYTFTDPLTCVFETSSRLTQGINSAHFMIYNLSAEKRRDIQFDSAIDIDGGGHVIRRTFQFSAGYLSEGYQPVIFQGNISKAFSYRDSGSADVITDICVMDGQDAVQRSQVASSSAHPWGAKAEVAKLVKTMNQHGVTLGAVGSLFDGLTSTRGVTWLGSTWDVLKRLAGANNGVAFINMEKVYLLSASDSLLFPGAIPKLDASTGLMGTPRRSGWTVDAEMIFEPRVYAGQRLQVDSTVEPSINGDFRVDAVSHRGIISGAKDGGVVTAFSLFHPKEGLETVPTL